MTRRLASIALLILALLTNGTANADCVNPAGPEGEAIYNGDHKVMQFCNGTKWISMAASGTATEVDPHVGTLTNGKWCSTNGSIINCTADAPGAASQWVTSGSDIYYSTGNVGIGNAAPLGPLSIGNSSVSNADGFIVIGKNNGLGGSRHFKVGFDSNFNFVIGDYGAFNTAGTWTSPFAIAWNAPSSSLFIQGSGNVGIGTTTVNTNLHVFGADSNTYGQLEVHSSGNDAHISLYNANGATTTGRGDIIMSKTAGYEGLRFLINGIDKMILDESGNVGIGTTAPGNTLDVNGTIKVRGLGIYNNAGYQMLEGNAIDWLRINGTQSYTNGVAAYGNWAFGTGGIAIGGWTNPGAGNLTATGTVTANALSLTPVNPSITSGGSYIVIPNGIYVSGGTAYFQTQAQFRSGIHNDTAAYLQVDGGTSGYTYFNGNVGIGTNAPTQLLHVNGTAYATTFLHTSDRRLKTNIQPIKSALDLNDRLQGVHFNWKKDGKPSFGIIAQDVENVMPDAVTTNTDGTKAVDYDQLVPVLIESIKELRKEVEALKRLQKQ